MSIAIDAAKCTGCGQCVEICPGSLIEADAQGKAYIRYPRDCWGCASCIKACAAQAIGLYLGADIGGMGGRMHVVRNGAFLDWTVTKADGEQKTIRIDRTQSNQY